MDAIGRAKSTIQSQIEEILNNAQIRQSFSSFFVANASELYAHQSLRKDIRAELTRVLLLKKTDPSAIYRGLLLQLNSAFELFVKRLVGAVLLHHRSKVQKYSDLSVAIRNTHAVKSAEILRKLYDGKINGVNYDFDHLQKSLGTCFSDKEEFDLTPDVFTLLMGNCTPERLEKLFSVIGISKPFDENTGKNQAIKKWAKGIGPKQAANEARRELESQLSKRNEIAHGPNTMSVSPTDIEQAGAFYLALADAFIDKFHAL